MSRHALDSPEHNVARRLVRPTAALPEADALPQGLHQAKAAASPASCIVAVESTLWTGDERLFQQLMQATRLYQDRQWRAENFPSKKKATAFLRKRYPQLRACPLELKQLLPVVPPFPRPGRLAALSLRHQPALAGVPGSAMPPSPTPGSPPSGQSTVGLYLRECRAWVEKSVRRPAAVGDPRYPLALGR